MRVIGHLFAAKNFAHRTVMFAVAMLVSLFAVSQLQAAQTSPFTTLKGSWKGSGLFSLANGTKERISCNSYYTGGGSQLRLAILCKSANNEIHMRGKVSYSGGRLSGTWEERTFNAEGNLSGKASKNKLSMSVSGNVTGSMIVSYTKRTQNVSISITGSPLRSVNITLRR